MADIKTTFRELSVIYGIIKSFKNTQSKNFEDFISILTPWAKDSVSFSLINPKDITDHKDIIENGLKIAASLIKIFKIKKLPKLLWVGENTQSGTPADVYVGQLPISLKEESYILENMGLYSLVNILTNSKYSRGELHIFKTFAPEKYKEWFLVTWQLLVEHLEKNPEVTVSSVGKGYLSKITLQKDGQIIFQYKKAKKLLKVVLATDTELSDFEEKTSSLIREKVFAKWINTYASSNPLYLAIKRECAELAGKNLIKLINEEKDIFNLARLLRILDEKYYYVKASRGKVEIYEVPSIKEFLQNFNIESLKYSVPKSQLNFYTRLVNNITGKDFTLRNEIRFSHGQFNGTPEAKLYVERNSLLNVVYKKIYDASFTNQAVAEM